MSLRAVAAKALRATGRAITWTAHWADDVITSAKGKVDSNDVKAVAAKLGPRLLASGTAAKGLTAAGLIRETLLDQDVFLAAFALAGAIVWSCLEVIGRHRAAPTPPEAQQP